MADDARKEFAFYYPGHVWRSGEWVKNLLLYFDGIALLVPEYKMSEPEQLDPVVAGALASEQLLHKFSADHVVDHDATVRLGDALFPVLESGALDGLRTSDAFHSISMSRMGWYGAPEIAERLFHELVRRGLARESEDGVSIPMHPIVRVLILALLSQILRALGGSHGVELSPATDRADVVEALTDILAVASREPSVGDVVAFDLETVGVDLSHVPIDEVLSFRREHLEQHKAYARKIREFLVQTSVTAPELRGRAFRDRQDEIRQLANDLKNVSRRAWRKPASFGLTIAGAAWTLTSGDVTGSLLAALGAMLGYERVNLPGTAYSYLFSAADRLR
jgi:hypothetical protein